MLIIRGVNVFPTQVEELILADRRLAPHYVLESARRPARHADGGRRTASPGGSGVTGGGGAAGKRIKDRIGVSAKSRPVDSGTVARSVGKAKRVVDLR
jgi:phenylacetate-CoA ligase